MFHTSSLVLFCFVFLSCTVRQEPISIGKGCPSIARIDVPSADAELLDDFEDGDLAVLMHGGRTGQWTLFEDDTDPTVNVANRSECAALGSRALRVETAGTRSWGAAASVSFLAEPSTAYDLSGYRGLSFWAADMAPGDGLLLRFGLNTTDTAFGHGCTVCGDNYNAEVSLSPEWQHVQVDFSQLAQNGSGMPQTPLHLERALTLDLWVSPRGVLNMSLVPVPGGPVELWLDDLRLLR